ncbi:hypothetical protein DAEQUDRAFT_724589 [Daedalea quercina L-15889]|uniref:HMG box domain-containing protein n=1 Tax=Daedalea quercina L-15889 TaxID=1314783 RepID=A0A165RVF6_9APHY|nr:hypothetical protein DAEQUDRAFT_724589 [Daedalea quercina L-15889]
MLPQLAQRVALRTIHATFTRCAAFAPSIFVTRLRVPTRTFLSSSLPRLAPASRKSTKKGRKAVGAKPKKTAKATKKVVKAKSRSKKPQKLRRVLKEDLPPKHPPVACILHFQDYVKSHPVSSLEDARLRLKEAYGVWASMDAAAHQPWIDRSKALLAEYPRRLAEWYRKTDEETVKAVEKRFKARGRILTKDPDRERRPAPAFLRFWSDYRKTLSVSGREVLTYTTEAAAKWRSLSDEEKAPYFDSYRQALAAYHAKRGKAPKTASD